MISREAIRHWMSLQANLKAVKKQEMDLRRELSLELIPAGRFGTNTMMVGDIELKTSVPTSFSLSGDDVRAAMDILTDEEKECIVWKPSLIKKNYDKLPDNNNLKKIVVMKIGAPTLSTIIQE